jgi:hypothetical protein
MGEKESAGIVGGEQTMGERTEVLERETERKV